MAQRADTLVWVPDSLVAQWHEGAFSEDYRVLWARFTGVPPAVVARLDSINPILRQASAQGAGAAGLLKYKELLKQAAHDGESNYGGATQWAYAEVWNVPRNDAQWLTLENSYYEYQGGAHGMYNTQYFNLHRPTNRLVRLSDLFRPRLYQTALDTAEAYFRAAMQEHVGGEYNPAAPLAEAGFSFLNDQFSLPDNFTLLPGHIVFTYNLYTIAPYVMGEITFQVPLSAFRGMLNPVYFP